MNCPFLSNDQCGLVAELVNKPCPVKPATCSACLSTDRPSRINLVTIALAQKLSPAPRSTSERNILAIDLNNPDLINQLGNGFGSRLHALISPFLSEIEGCKCSGHRDILDLWTPEYIQKNIDRVVQWLAYEARKRSIPFSYIATRLSLLALLRFQ
jgi:hypothetical protein